MTAVLQTLNQKFKLTSKSDYYIYMIISMDKCVHRNNAKYEWHERYLLKIDFGDNPKE